uniref:IS66 family transposase n=1 Tax=Bacteroides nordii TaxID=291645 RepID=UPI0039C18218
MTAIHPFGALDHFWTELFAVLNDRNLPIDNNLTERTLRKLTTQCNNMLHFGSDEGVNMVAAYHSVISTVKFHGRSAWDICVIFFKNIFNGYRGYVNLTPRNIGLTVINR